MSLRYAEKLSYKADVGTVGMPELFDSALDLKCKVEALSQLIKEAFLLHVASPIFEAQKAFGPYSTKASRCQR
jgi:hypothetical protein